MFPATKIQELFICYVSNKTMGHAVKKKIINGVMHPDMNQSTSHPKVDYFPLTAHPDGFYSSCAPEISQQLHFLLIIEMTSCTFFIHFLISLLLCIQYYVYV